MLDNAFQVCHNGIVGEQSASHKAECEILGRAKGRINVDDMNKPHPVYECITPLRCIMLKTASPKQYEVRIVNAIYWLALDKQS